MTDQAQANPKEADTFPKLLRACAAAYGDSIAIELVGEGAHGKTLSFASLDRCSAALADALIVRGAGKGTRIGFIFGNGPDFAVVLAAISRIGAIAVPISTLVRAEELVRVLRQSDVAGLILQRFLLGHDLVERLCEALPELRAADPAGLRLMQVPFLRWAASSGPGLPASIDDIGDLSADPEGLDDRFLREIESEVHSTDQMLEIYTSGSMALPKGVRHNHSPVMQRVNYMATIDGRERGTSAAIPLPMFWVGGLGLCFLANLASGVRSVCTEGTSTNSRSARGSVMGTDAIKERAREKPYWSLGMTETFGPYSIGEEIRAEGHPLAPPLDQIATGFEVRVADASNEPIAIGAVGEIQVRGYAVTPGLHKMERSAHFTADGYYRTGDLGLLEGERIHFLGRGGDMIKTAKANVSPAEVEMELQTIDGVASAFVIGIPDPERGEIVAAALVPRDGMTLDFGAIERALKAKLSTYKVPRAFAQFERDEIPMLPSNKVARRELIARIEKKIGRSGG
jgi:acyl-CoA synthetase (AMP-forming)/AMP-acid ligase II